MPNIRISLWLQSIAGLLLTIAAIGLGWLPPLFDTEINPVLDFLRNSNLGNYLARVSLILGAGLLLQVWLRVGKSIFIYASYSLPELLKLLGIPTALLFFSPPLFSRDVYSYMAQARLYLRGLNPYEYGVGWLPGWFKLGSDPMWVDSPTPYGPIAIWLSARIEIQCGGSPYLGLLLHRGLAVLGVALGVWATYRLLQPNLKLASAAIWLAWLNPLVVMHFISAAHNDALMLGLVLTGFALAESKFGRYRLIWIVLAAAIKPIALLAAPFLVAYPNRRSLLQLLFPWAMGAIGVILGLFGLGLITGLGMGWISALSAPTKVRSLLSPVTAIGELLSRPLEFFNLLAADNFIQNWQILWMLIALGIVGYLLATANVRSGLRGAAIAFTVVVGLSPVVHVWYLLWAFGLIAVSGISKAWHLRAIVLLTTGLVSYSAIEANVVLDSAITWTDFVAGASAAFAVLLVFWFSHEERDLLVGNQFDDGLRAEHFAADLTNQA